MKPSLWSLWDEDFGAWVGPDQETGRCWENQAYVEYMARTVSEKTGRRIVAKKLPEDARFQ